MENLRTTWQLLTASYTSDKERVANLWTRLEKGYSEKGRHYHNFRHLEYMIDNSAAIRHRLEDPDTLLFSILYHDAVYDILRKDNELKSAEMATTAMGLLGVPFEKIARCKAQIIATKNHAPTGDPDLNYLLDLDLAILGDSPEAYRDYTRKIRQEYSIYPDLLYKPGRRKVLQHFLKMERIFKTPELYASREPAARKNLETELLELS